MKEPTANILKESALTHKPFELALFLTSNEQTNVYLKKSIKKTLNYMTEAAWDLS